MLAMPVLGAPCFVQPLAAQALTNVRASQQGAKVLITYDLAGNAPLKVSAYCSDRPSEALKAVSGHVGVVSPGAGRQIVWDALADREYLTGTYTFTLKGNADVPAWMPETVFVPAGSFQMGCPDGMAGCQSDEKPIHTVSLKAFHLAKTEITVAQYRAYCELTGKSMPAPPPGGFKDDIPISNVTWAEAQAFCQWLSAQTGQTWRLPTEAEWEYAAKGGPQSAQREATAYVGNASVDVVGWVDHNSGARPHPVAQKQPNALGLYDMSGNVWEWCSDWYSSTYYHDATPENPTGPPSGTGRALRGGSWYAPASSARVSERSADNPAGRNFARGFRPLREN